MKAIHPSELLEIRQLALQDQYMEALLRLRRATGAALKPAQECLEFLLAHHPTRSAGPGSRADGLESLSNAQWNRLAYLLWREERMAAAKHLRTSLPLQSDTVSEILRRCKRPMGPPPVTDAQLVAALEDVAALQAASGLDQEGAARIMSVLQGCAPEAAQAPAPESPASAALPPESAKRPGLAGTKGGDRGVRSLDEFPGLARLAESLPEPEDPSLPRWIRQARERGIGQVVLYCDKANGLVLLPRCADMPIAIGGDHDGTYPYTPREAIEALSPRRAAGKVDRRVAALLPYLEKMVAGVDFELDDLIRDCDATVRKG